MRRQPNTAGARGDDTLPTASAAPTDRMKARLPLVFGFVLGPAFLLLLRRPSCAACCCPRR